MSAILDMPVINPPASIFNAEIPRPRTIIVAGNPNAGKTSLFNSLTGLRQKVANYPGVTVESKSGQWTISADLPPARLIDLPGLYSLNATSLDEKIASDMLVDRKRMHADAIIVVVDATNLVRNLYLAQQLIETKQPIVIALTMFDLAEKSNLQINLKKLSASLGVPVIPVVAKQRRGLDDLAWAVLVLLESGPRHRSSPEGEKENSDLANPQTKLIQRYA